MKRLSEQQYQSLIAGGHVLEKDGNGPKVITLGDERYFKAFYHKSWFSASHFISRAQKFANNAEKLKQKGVTTVETEQVFKLDNPKRHCVVYKGVPGITVRQALKEQPRDSELSRKVGAYVAQLQTKGVLFRSLHLGNIIVMPNGELALIDISDMTVHSFALIRWQRKRNFLHILRYRNDKDLLDLEAFQQGYIAADPQQTFADNELLPILEKTLPKAER